MDRRDAKYKGQPLKRYLATVVGDLEAMRELVLATQNYRRTPKALTAVLRMARRDIEEFERALHRDVGEVHVHRDEYGTIRVELRVCARGKSGTYHACCLDCPRRKS